MKDLSDYVKRLEAKGLALDSHGFFEKVYIDRLANDSRKVGPNALFVAIKGDRADGHLFIDKAVQNGAIAIVCEAIPADAFTRFPGIAFIRVINARAALAEVAALYYDDPARSLEMIGVTGTNGKTTTAYLVFDLLTRLGHKAGLLSTVEYRIGSKIASATHTTPDVLDTNRMLREMVDGGCSVCVMEVSSHALDQERVRGIPYKVAVFTNLSQDHLDYHKTMPAYLAAKKRLFDGLDPEASAIYNLDDRAGIAMVKDCSAALFSYGIEKTAMIQGRIVSNELEGLQLSIEGQIQRFKLVGRFNAYNLLAAYGVAIALGYDGHETRSALALASPVPGRFQMLRTGNRYVIVDYAHTPDALENVLLTIRKTKPAGSILWCVFGCGGDRDAGKRPLMGRIAEAHADRVIVTSDNPRTESPEAILEDIKAGMKHPDEAFWIVNRREAIRHAASVAAEGDVVLIAGKGHEDYQVIGTGRIHFDDREESISAFGKS